MNKQEWLDRQTNIFLIEAKNPTHVITLNTHEIDAYQATVATIMEFERRLNRALFGRNWRKDNNKLDWVHNYERERSNAHSHSFVRIDKEMEKRFKSHVRRIWNGLTKSRDTKRRVFIDTYNYGAAVYSTKQATRISETA